MRNPGIRLKITFGSQVIGTAAVRDVFRAARGRLLLEG
jgi:hypothetical protein